MTIQYIPLGIPVSTSLAIDAGYATSVTYGAITASTSEYVLFPVGPAGSNYKVVSGSKVIISNV